IPLTCHPASSSLCYFNDAPPTELYTLSLHDALPIFRSDHETCSQPHCPNSGSSPPTSCTTSRVTYSMHPRVAWYATWCSSWYRISNPLLDEPLGRWKAHMRCGSDAST